MRDIYGRKIDYLRISVTDRCNLRCKYCMPSDGIRKRGHGDVLSIEEILEIAGAAVSMGVSKIRITGGEPLVRFGILDLCRGIAGMNGVKDLTITTNGVLLYSMADQLKAAGVNRVNISLDSLNREKYAQITRGGDLEQALKGIQAARRAGLTPVKLNVVLIGGFNDDEIEDFVAMTAEWDVHVRFIELMPIGEGAPYWESGYLSNQTVLERLPELEPVESNGVARLYRLPGAPGRVGLINPISGHFCESCNRLRLTADGMLKPCLHSRVEIPVRDLHGAELEAEIKRAVSSKMAARDELSAERPSVAGRCMNQIGG